MEPHEVRPFYYVHDILGPGGWFERRVPGYKSREEQVRLAEAFANYLLLSDHRTGRHRPFVAEAPCGTGKTYAYLDGRTTKSLATTSSSQLPVVAVPALGKVPSLTPRNSASVWVMKDLGQGLRLGGGVSHVGERFTSLTNLVTLPAYTTFDAALQFALGEWDLDVNVKNLTNRKHYVSAHGSNDNLILPGSPRAVQVTLRTHF